MKRPRFYDSQDTFDWIESLEDDLSHLAHVFLSLMEGDTHLVEEAYEILKRRKFCDEDGFEIYDEDEGG